MAKKEGYIIDLNKLREVDKNGNVSKVNRMIFDGKEIYIVRTKTERKYNKAWYHLYVEDGVVVVRPNGELDEPLVVTSTKQDFQGEEQEVKYTSTLDNVGINTEEVEKSGNFEIIQENSRYTISGTYKQQADFVEKNVYSDIEITGVNIPRISAAGTEGVPREISVSYSAFETPVWASGKEAESKPVSSTLVSWDEMVVEYIADNATFDKESNEYEVDSLMKNPMPETEILRITYVKATIYGLTKEWSGIASGMQDANYRYEYTRSELLDISCNGDYPRVEILAGNSTATVYVANACIRKSMMWTSGEDGGYDYELGSAYLTTTLGTWKSNGSTSIYVSDSSSAILEIGTNTSTTSTRTAVITATYGSLSRKLTIVQQAAQTQDYWGDPEITNVHWGYVGANGSASIIEVTYTQNKYRGNSGGGTPEIIDTDVKTVAPSSINATVVSGSGATLSGNKITGRNLGTNVKENATHVYTIHSVTVTANASLTDTEYFYGTAGYVYQEPNLKKEQNRTYSLSISVDGSDEVLATSTYALLTASAMAKVDYRYTALPDTPYYEDEEATANVVAIGTDASVSPTSITGENKSVRLNFPANDTLSDREFGAKLSVGTTSSEPTYVTQLAAEEEYYWESPSANSLSFGEIPASGTPISIYVHYTQRYMKKVGTTTSVHKEYKTSIEASSVSGSPYTTSSTGYVSGNKVGAESLGKNLATSTTPQFNISGGSYVAADGKTYNFSLSGTVYQAKNEKGTITTSYVLSLSPTSLSMNAKGEAVYIGVTAYKEDSWTWSSGTPDSSKTGGTVSVTATGGSVTSSVYNGGNISFSSDLNESTSSRNYTITATYADAKKTATATVTQSGSSYVFDIPSQSTVVGYGGGTFKIYANSYMNGESLAPTASVSGLYGASVTAVNELSSVTIGNIEIVLSVPSNSSSSRSFTLTLKQPNSNQTKTVTITQEAYTASFSISLASSSYFKRTGTNTFQFYGTANVTSTKAATIYGTWYYTAIDEDGIPVGSTYADPKGQQTVSIYSYNHTFSYTGTAVEISEASAAGFAGIRAEFRSTSSSGSFGGNVFNIQ